MISKLFLAIAFILIVQSKAKLPSYVRECKRSDSGFAACYKENFEKVVPMLKNDLPELSMKAIDPMTISSLQIEYGNPSATAFIKAEITKCIVRGLSGTELVYNNATFRDNGADFFLHTNGPSLFLKGAYQAKGKILLVPLDTSGEATVNLTDVEVFCNWHATPYQKNGREYYKHEGQNIRIKFKYGQVYFGNLFPGNPELTESTNQAINENIDTVLKEIGPTLRNLLEELIRHTFESVFTTFPADELYPL